MATAAQEDYFQQLLYEKTKECDGWQDEAKKFKHQISSFEKALRKIKRELGEKNREIRNLTEEAKKEINVRDQHI